MIWKHGEVEEYPVAANALIGLGAVVIPDANGYATAATAAGTGQRILGIAGEAVNNTGGANGAKRVSVLKRGIVDATFASGAVFTQANIGQPAYLDGYDALAQRPTVHNTSTGRTALGTVVAVQGSTVYVLLATV